MTHSSSFAPSAEQLLVGIGNALDAKDLVAATAMMVELAKVDPEQAEVLYDTIRLFVKEY